MSAIPIGADKMFCMVNGVTRSVAWLFANADAATHVWLSDLPGLTRLPNLDAATHVWLSDLPGLTRLPNLDAATSVVLNKLPGITTLLNLDTATYVTLYNLPGLTSLPGLDAATHVWLKNLPGLTSLPDMDAATDVTFNNLPGLTSLPNMDAATDVTLSGLPGLTSLPDMDAATDVWLENLPGLTVSYAGKDSRHYQFFVIRMRNEWRIIAGCRNFSFREAREHWGPGGASDRPDCLALVEKLIASSPTIRARVGAPHDCGAAMLERGSLKMSAIPIGADEMLCMVNGFTRSVAWLFANTDIATDVTLSGLPGLTSLPRLDAATNVYLNKLPGLTFAYAGKDSRHYQFFVIHMRGEWRIIAGCQNFSFDEARKHWGPEGESDRPDCLALVEKLIASVQVTA